MIVVDMDMPKSCFECKLVGEGIYGDYCCADGTIDYRDREKRPADCPIVAELPKGHGRLIDADAFQKYCFNKNFEMRLSDGGLFFINLFLSDAPTILEADKAESENKE